MMRTSRQVRDTSHMLLWMRTYAEWLSLECLRPPSIPVRMARARGFARQPVTRPQLRLLEQRADFVAYCAELKRGPLEAARLKFASRFPEYVDAHYEALEQARIAQDYKAVAQIAEPVLDRIMPKKGEGTVAPSVTIVLSPGQQAGLASYTAPDMLVDEVPPPALPAEAE